MKALCILLHVLATTYAFDIPDQEGIFNAIHKDRFYFDTSRLKGKGTTATTTTTNTETDIIHNRKTQSNTQCTLCVRYGSQLVPDVIPSSLHPDKTCQSWYDTILEMTDPSDQCETYLSKFERRCCDLSFFPEDYQCASNIRSNLLNDSYDTSAAPIPSTNGTMRALNVNFMLTYVAVKSVDVKTSTLEIFADVTMIWNDPRLRWDIGLDTCVVSVPMRASSSVEETEIWVPSLDLVNRATSLQDLPIKNANVYADGSVVWSRLGSLTAICTFVGLKRMPFDDLGCRLYFAGSELTSSIDYTLSINANNEKTPGLDYFDYKINYSEFAILKEKSQTGHLSEWASDGFFTELYFHRARSHYIYFSIFPSVLFTIMSFGQYAISITSGERLSFSVTVVLITVTQSIVTASYLPVCREQLWLNSFNFVTMSFTLFGIIETLLILWYYMIKHKMVEEEEERKKLNAMKNNYEEHDSLILEQANENQKDDLNNNSNAEFNNEDGLDRVNGVTIENTTTNSSLKSGTTSLSKSKVLQFLKKKVDGKSDRPLELVNKIDRFALFSLPISYLIFCIVMFATNHKWEGEPKWSQEL